MGADQPPVRRGFGFRLLVVDADRELVDRVLSNARRPDREVEAVAVARTGAEAIALAREFRPDFLLIDPYLPDGDGMEALARILAEARCTAVVVTRRTEPEDISRAMAYGARGYVVKPIAAHSLLSSRGCVVGPVDYLYDLLAPAPPEPQVGEAL